MAKRTNGIGLVIKWLVVPIGLGCLGYFVIGPKLYVHGGTNLNTKIANIANKVAPNAVKKKAVKTEIAPDSSGGPDVSVTESPANGQNESVSTASYQSATTHDSANTPVSSNNDSNGDAEPMNQEVANDEASGEIEGRKRHHEIRHHRSNSSDQGEDAMRKDTGSLGGTLSDKTPSKKTASSGDTTPGF